MYASSSCITVATSQYVINSEFKTHSSNTENSHHKASNANKNQTELNVNVIKTLQSYEMNAKHSMLQYTSYTSGDTLLVPVFLQLTVTATEIEQEIF